jgi:carbon monoxide dehydrogenase subunit G
VKINGTATLNAPRDRVWAALNDPGVLVRTIPGCEKLEALGEDRYTMTVTAGVASIKGTYLGDVALTDPEPPTAFTLKASGAGAPGTVNADVRVTLDESGDGRTLLSYAADAVVGGVAKKTAGEFFRNVDAVLAEQPGVAVPGQAGSPALEAAAGAPSVEQVEDAVNGATPAGQGAPQTVFTRPPAAGGGRTVQVDVRNQLPAVLVGAVIALAGVWLGSRLARSRR